MKEATLREAIDQPKLRMVRDWLRNYEDRSASSSYSENQRLLTILKREAVSEGDQLTAKAVWCLETIGRVQNHFESAFRLLKQNEFRDAWDNLDRCDTEIFFLSRHFIEDDREFGLEHARFHTRQFQDVFLLKGGFSPGFLFTDVRCSICGTKMTLRGGCNHKAGNIYDGEMCTRVIFECKALHISLVDNPAQKVSVIFPSKNEDDRFRLVKYVVDALRTPWHGWGYVKEERRQYHPAFVGVSVDEPCPCGSPITYKNCCGNKETVFPHFDVFFEKQPLIKPPLFEVHTMMNRRDKES